MQKDLELKRAHIFRGRQHKLAFLALQEKSLLVTEIMRAANAQVQQSNQVKEATPSYDGKEAQEEKTLSIRETSRALKWLAEHGYAECLNPSSEHGVKGILYKLTSEGKAIKKFVDTY